MLTVVLPLLIYTRAEFSKNYQSANYPIGALNLIAFRLEGDTSV